MSVDRATVRSAAAGLAAVLLIAVSACADGATDGSAGAPTTGRPPPAVGPATAPPGSADAARASGPSAGCGLDAPAAPGTADERLTSGGVERSYQLIVPAGYDGRTPLPLVLGLHSLTVDYRIVPGMSGFGDMAGRYDFIGVAPSGRLGPSGLPFWNAAQVPDNDDLHFLTELLDHLEAGLCVDTGRVFSVGMSNGAQMSSLLACRLGDRIAAIAPIAGVEHDEPCDGPPVPVIAFHGDADPIVPYGGGGLSSVAVAKQNLPAGGFPEGVPAPPGVDESMRRWAEHNGCRPEPSEERVSSEVRRRVWDGCTAPTELYVVEGGGHAWPGKPQPAFEASFGHGTTEIDATDLMFRFFLDPGT